MLVFRWVAYVWNYIDFCFLKEVKEKQQSFTQITSQHKTHEAKDISHTEILQKVTLSCMGYSLDGSKLIYRAQLIKSTVESRPN
jgi:hypothetical protein